MRRGRMLPGSRGARGDPGVPGGAEPAAGGRDVRAGLVVEDAYDGLRTSTRYPAGVTLRFARVVRYREDKVAAEADTVETVLAAHDRPVSGGPAGSGPPVVPGEPRRDG
ncbi:hypothetical protein ADL21_31730 [Streptomyces albus subsp. albus]|nr:hypothetical protein ADL21_31730 [Streptomyces albus subsp. albus]